MRQPLQFTPTQYKVIYLKSQGAHSKKIVREVFAGKKSGVALVYAHTRNACVRNGAESIDQLMFWYGQRGGAIAKQVRPKKESTK